MPQLRRGIMESHFSQHELLSCYLRSVAAGRVSLERTFDLVCNEIYLRNRQGQRLKRTHSIGCDLWHVIGEDAVHGDVRVDRNDDAHR